MIALRFYGRRDIRLEELPKPKPQDDEVLIRVTDAGISQTQINEFVEGPYHKQRPTSSYKQKHPVDTMPRVWWHS